MRLSSRIDATASRVQTAVTMKQVTGSMAGVVKSLESAMRSMNLEKVYTCMWNVVKGLVEGECKVR